MENTVVVGGQVQGNISSCEFKVSVIKTGRKNVFIDTTQSLAVNNCSGEVIKANSWEFTADGVLIIFMGAIFTILFLNAIAHIIHGDY